METPTTKEVPPKVEVKQEPETPTEASNVEDEDQEATDVQAPVKIAEPEDEFSAETPVPRTYHITGRQVLIVFPQLRQDGGRQGLQHL